MLATNRKDLRRLGEYSLEIFDKSKRLATAWENPENEAAFCPKFVAGSLYVAIIDIENLVPAKVVELLPTA